MGEYQEWLQEQARIVQYGITVLLREAKCKDVKPNPVLSKRLYTLRNRQNDYLTALAMVNEFHSEMLEPPWTKLDLDVS